MPRPDDSLIQFEKRLAAAAAAFGHGLRQHLAAAADGTGRIVLAAVPCDMVGLRAEEGRLRRMARRNAPAYDLNRHIAVRRLLAIGEAGAFSRS